MKKTEMEIKPGSDISKLERTAKITTVLLIIMIILFFRYCVFGFTTVSGNSMLPSVYNGDRMIYVRSANFIDRYDIIIFRSDLDNNLYIKRVVAMPGETVWFSEDGYLYINGEKVEDEYFTEPVEYIFNGGQEITLGEGEYYALGDNHSSSIDSRVLGPVKEEDIRGEVIFRILPLNRIGII